MKKQVLFFALAISLFISCNKFSPTITKITPQSYLALKGKINKKTIVHFWFSLCQPCIEDYPKLNAIVNKNHLKLINISSDKSDSKMEDNMARIMKQIKMENSYIIDFNNLYPTGTRDINIYSDFAKQVGIKNISNPLYILYDKDGTLLIASSQLTEIEKYIKGFN